VGEGSDGEGELVGGVRVADEAENEVAGTDVVGEVAEEWLAERIVAEILNGAAAVCVCVGFVDLSFGEVGEAREQKRADGLLPGKVDELLVGLDGVGTAGLGENEEKDY
jgi:hypothetical protein